jgi:BON domain/Double zinc ribbon
MICAKCQASIAEGKKFCGQCGAPVNITFSNRCPGCGKDLVPGKKFCGACGRQVQEQETVPYGSVLSDPPREAQPAIQNRPEVERTGFTDVPVSAAPMSFMSGSENRQNWLPLAIVVVLLGAAVYLGVRLLSAPDKTTHQATSRASSPVVEHQSTAPTLSDDQLFSDIQSSLREEPALAKEPIHVLVGHGRVSLNGSVKSLAARALAERKVSQVKGVVTLIDNLAVQTKGR